MLKYFLLSPLSWLFALFLAGLLPLPRWARRVVLAAAIVVWLLIAPLGANVLVGLLENAPTGNDAACESDPPRTLVLLAGGLEGLWATQPGVENLSPESYRRTIEAARLAAAQPGSRMIITGSGSGGTSESKLMAALANAFGAPAEAIVVEEASPTTADSARNVVRYFGDSPRRIGLVTSAIHMPRSALAFEAAGFTVCRRPVDRTYLAPGGAGPSYYFPNTQGLRKAERALHEIAGLAIYRFR